MTIAESLKLVEEWRGDGVNWTARQPVRLRGHPPHPKLQKS